MGVGIVGSATDLHSEVVRWALVQGGVDCRLLDTLSGFYNDVGASLFVSADRQSHHALADVDLRALWYRRHYRLRTASDAQSDENAAFRTSERDAFQDSVISSLSIDERIAWINNPQRLSVAESKFAQLLFAKKAGLAIPATLMSSEPAQIRAFAKAHDVIAIKPFGVYAWKYSDQRTRYAAASKIESGMIVASSDDALSNTPTIYQSAIDKVSDLRVVVLEDEIYAYDIRQPGTAEFDSRFAMSDPSRTTIQPHPLTDDQRRRIHALMRLAGIEMASADFALTPDGDIVFLDLNPAGAWLFLEQRVPEISLTDRLCRRLAQKAGLDARFRFPTYRQFLETGAMEAFKQNCAEKAQAGFTVMNDRTWEMRDSQVA